MDRQKMERKNSVVSKTNFIITNVFGGRNLAAFCYPIHGNLEKRERDFFLCLFHWSGSASRVTTVETKSCVSIWSPNRYLLNIYYVPGTLLCTSCLNGF